MFQNSVEAADADFAVQRVRRVHLERGRIAIAEGAARQQFRDLRGRGWPECSQNVHKPFGKSRSGNVCVMTSTSTLFPNSISLRNEMFREMCVCLIFKSALFDFFFSPSGRHRRRRGGKGRGRGSSRSAAGPAEKGLSVSGRSKLANYFANFAKGRMSTKDTSE